MNLTVREELGAHIIKVITLLKVPEILPENRVIQNGQFLGLSIKLVVSILLELVSKPCGHIPLLIGP